MRDDMRLLVANDHQALAKIFEGTPYADKRWKEALERGPALPDRGPCLGQSVRLCGIKVRVTVLPPYYLPFEDQGGTVLDPHRSA
jgi:hypothetical protein